MIIYKITNKLNNKIYIGQTTRNLKERLLEHKRKDCIIGRAFKKYGVESFETEIIDTAKTIEELNYKEMYWVKHFDCIDPKGYNLCEGGGNTLGFKHREESKKKMSENRKRKFSGEDNHFYGKKHSEETRKKMSEMKKKYIYDGQPKKIGIFFTAPVINLDTGEIFQTVSEAARKYNLKTTHISRVCRGGRKRTGGFRWAYYKKKL